MPRWRSPSGPTAEVAATSARADLALPAGAGKVLLPIARAAIACGLGVRMSPDESAPWLHEPGACFVTLTTAGELHGCIGSVEARRTLLADLTANARAAAFSDRRFPRLTRGELDDTVIEVSVLSPPTLLTFTSEADAVAQLRPGLDGGILEYGERRATFLPQVWAHLPEPSEFLAHLKMKAGLPATFWSDGVTLRRYAVTSFREVSRDERRRDA